MNFKKYWILIAISVVIFSCKKQIEPKEVYEDMPGSGTLSFLTYNVAGLPEGINSDQFPSKHIHLISPLLNNFDVVNVQEDFAYHDKLYKDIQHKYKTKYVADLVFGDGLNTLAIMPILDYKRTRWDSCNGFDCLTPKGFTYSRLRFNATSFIDFYNVHTNAGDSEEDMRARRNNIIQLMEFMEKYSKGNTVVIMGDFNSRYTRVGDNIKLLSDSLGFKDVWVELLRNGVYPEKNDIALKDCETTYSNSGCEVVDKVLYRNSSDIELKPVFFDQDNPAFFDDSGMPLSDHRPMNVKFEYKVK